MGAVSAEEVYEAVVDEVAAAIDASSAALFAVSGEGMTSLVRSLGYSEAAKRMLEHVPVDTAASFPALDALRTGEPQWISSRKDLEAAYPHLTAVTSHDRSYQIACLPLIVEGRTTAALALTFDGAPPMTAEQRSFLRLIARYAGQALERLRLLDAERKHRTRAELLYGLARTVIAASDVEAVFEAALRALELALGAHRSAILTFDGSERMRFRAFRGLSEAYREAVDGHSPWTRDANDPQPIAVPDVESDPAMAVYLPVFRAEGIGAIAFVPLVAAGRLRGKLMVYYERPRALDVSELALAVAIADHVAAAIDRFGAISELEATVRFNELFTGILGHDLRNPLGAILTAAQLAMTLGESERLVKPLSRIMTSGNRMARMIDQLLDFTRLRMKSGMPIRPTRFDLVPLVQTVMDELDDANPDWTLRLEPRGDTEGAWDSDRLSQVFSNLVANGLQHGEPANGLHVAIDGSEPDHVRVEVHNGGAIGPGLIAHVFEPLTGGVRRHAKSQGLGLGLHISREIVKAHGGHIHVESTLAAGTTFVVTLPRVSSASEEPR